MFKDGGPKPWQTKLGESVLDERTASVAAEQRKASLDPDSEKTQVVKRDGRIEAVD